MEAAPEATTADPARALIARLLPELREAVLHQAFEVCCPDEHQLSEDER